MCAQTETSRVDTEQQIDVVPPRRFALVRSEDATGVSGTGIVATGVQFGDGTVAMRWATGTASTAVYSCIADVEAIHGHGGRTEVRFIDQVSSARVIGGPAQPIEDIDDWLASIVVTGAAASSLVSR